AARKTQASAAGQTHGLLGQVNADLLEPLLSGAGDVAVSIGDGRFPIARWPEACDQRGAEESAAAAGAIEQVLRIDAVAVSVDGENLGHQRVELRARLTEGRQPHQFDFTLVRIPAEKLRKRRVEPAERVRNVDRLQQFESSAFSPVDRRRVLLAVAVKDEHGAFGEARTIERA